MPEKNQGLFDKYEVARRDGKPLGACFVLEYDRDPFAFYALLAYASALGHHPVFMHLQYDLNTILARINTEGLDCRLDCPHCGGKHISAARTRKHVCSLPCCGQAFEPAFPFPTRGIA